MEIINSEWYNFSLVSSQVAKKSERVCQMLSVSNIEFNQPFSTYSLTSVLGVKRLISTTTVAPAQIRGSERGGDAGNSTLSSLNPTRPERGKFDAF